METLTEIREEEIARRQRAARYEALTAERLTLVGTIKRLEGATVNVDVLRNILALAADVPTDIVTDGTSTRGRNGNSFVCAVPGGANVRDVLLQVSENALAVAERRESKRATELAAKRARLAQVETELQEFNE